VSFLRVMTNTATRQEETPLRGIGRGVEINFAAVGRPRAGAQHFDCIVVMRTA
jgi:hypothetical protein